MRRVLTVVVAATAVCGLGCLGENSYETRLEKTLDYLKYQQQLNTFLKPAEQGKFKELNIFLRPPMPLDKAPASNLPAAAGQFDLAESFLGYPSTGSTSQGQGQGQAAGGGQGQGGAALQLHVLARFKKPPTAAGKKAAPPPTNRGPFLDDVRALIANYYGGGEAAMSGKLENVTERGRSYKRLQFQSATGNRINAYFYSQDNYDVALIWDFPPALANSPAVSSGIKYAMESFAVGRRASIAFAGGDEEEGQGGAGGAGGAPGVTF